ncbi:MAG: hypothetical protein OPY03_05840 [Nitrosopumilus sp.]|nr:hypothetical protein [Nitrosopumilus sp.]
MFVINILKSRYFLAFAITFGLILFEFDYFLNIAINSNVYLYATLSGGFMVLVSLSHKKGGIHFGVMLFMTGFVMLMVAGGVLLGGASFGDLGLCEGKCWTIPDGQNKTILAVISFVGLVLIVINFKAYMQNWIFAKPFHMRK